MALEDIDDFLFRWTGQCEPMKEKCVGCNDTDCQWWGDFNEDENPCIGCSNYNNSYCMAGVNNPDKCILNKKRG